jgi:hypothetical protein
VTRGPLFNRALQPLWLDWALQRATRGGEPAEQVRDLELSLREAVPAAGTREKVRQTATALWVSPPAEAAEMIGWARATAPALLDWRVLHLGALIAVHPFFGDVCAIVGRELGLMGDVHNAAIRKRMHSTWGQRPAIDVGVRAAVQTLRAFGVLSGVPGDPRSGPGETLAVEGALAAWLVHAAIVHSGGEALGEDALRQEPVLFMFGGDSNGLRGYPLLERHVEGGERAVLALR